MLLDPEEYVEQAYLFRTLNERMRQNMATQDLLSAIGEELLASTRLPMAVDFLSSELKLTGIFAPAMARLGHYFTSFQTFVVAQAESEQGRFDFGTALEILEREATYRSGSPTPQGVFVFQFETLCRNRLGYDKGLEAMSQDPVFNADWKEWILTVRRQIGLIDFADLIYLRSQEHVNVQLRQGADHGDPEKPVLFGEKEGKIALANRRKDPLFLFSALQRQLGYPAVPRLKPAEDPRASLQSVLRRIDRVESRLKLLEEEQQKGGIDLTKFYGDVRPPE